MPSALFLFDTTGYAAEPFTNAGWTTYIVDILNVGGRATNERATHVLSWDIQTNQEKLVEIAKTCKFVFGFPPCTDLAVSGAGSFAAKRAKNPNFQKEAVELARTVETIGNEAGVMWALENPVSVLSTLWRKPNYSFSPCNYGGYLPEDDRHPEYPRYIAPRDAYTKTTNIWCSPNFPKPPMKWVKPETPGASRQHRLLGGKSQKTKMIRSASPRGYFLALLEVMKEDE